MNNNEKSLNEQMLITCAEAYPSPIIEVIAEGIIEANPAVTGLAIGEVAPDFTLLNTEGEAVNLYKILAHSPVVLSFFRGEWCSLCNLEVRALQKSLPEIQALGAVLLTIHPQRIETSFRLVHKHQIDYQILNDPTQGVLEQYNVKFDIPRSILNVYLESFNIDVRKMNENGELTLPVPATFIIDKQGIVKSRFFSHDYTVRMDPKHILTALQNLPATTPEPIYESLLNATFISR